MTTLPHCFPASLPVIIIPRNVSVFDCADGSSGIGLHGDQTRDRPEMLGVERGHFFSEFNRLGGVQVLGYPASNTFTLPDGFIYQTTQAALLQWHPEDQPGGAVEMANVYDMLSKAGRDKDLQTLGIPPPIGDDGSGGNFQRAVDVRLGWLTQPEIKKRFLANPNPAAIKTWDAMSSIQLYGLPTSQPQRAGPYMVQRFQRVAFQLWLDAVPGQPAPGTVVPILGGDLAKRFAVVPVRWI